MLFCSMKDEIEFKNIKNKEDYCETLTAIDEKKLLRNFMMLNFDT